MPPRKRPSAAQAISDDGSEEDVGPVSLFAVAGLINSGKTESQTTIDSCQTRTCASIDCARAQLISQDAEASGTGNGEVMQKNDQGDEFLKVSQADLDQQRLMGSYPKPDD
jgi:hypothetical protein